MRKLGLVFLVGVALVLLPVISVLAFECPARIKEANDAISAVDPTVAKIGDAKKKGEAAAFITVAKDLSKAADADHKKAVDTKEASLHYVSAAKAKLAKMAADQAKALAK